MSPSVYDARPAYHHQETSPRFVPAIKISANPPLSAIRATQTSPSSKQADFFKKPVECGGVSIPLSTNATRQPKLPEHHLASSPNNKSPFRHTIRHSETPTALPQVHTSAGTPGNHLSQELSKPQALAIPQCQTAEVSCSPKLAKPLEHVDANKSTASIAVLRLQDDNSGAQLAMSCDAIAVRNGEVDELADELAEVSVRPKAAPPRQSISEALRASFGAEMDLSRSLKAFQSPLGASTSAAPRLLRSSLAVANPSLKASTSGRRPKVMEATKYRDLAGRPDNFSIRTADGYSFRVHKENLTVFTNMLCMLSRNAKAVDVSENYSVMSVLIPYFYPEIGTVELLKETVVAPFVMLLRALVAAKKYGLKDGPGDRLSAALVSVKPFKMSKFTVIS